MVGAPDPSPRPGNELRWIVKTIEAYASGIHRCFTVMLRREPRRSPQQWRTIRSPSSAQRNGTEVIGFGSSSHFSLIGIGREDSQSRACVFVVWCGQSATTARDRRLMDSLSLSNRTRLSRKPFMAWLYFESLSQTLIRFAFDGEDACDSQVDPGTEHEYGQIRPNAEPRERADTSCGRYRKGRPESWSRSWPNLLPNEEIKKLDETLATLDEKLFSLVDGEMPQIKADAALAPMTRIRVSGPVGQLFDGACSEGYQPATRRARVCSASSTGVTPKSRLNSRLNCDGLSYPTALAAVLALYPSWAMSLLAWSRRIRLRYWSGELAVTSLKLWWKAETLIPARLAISSAPSGLAYSAWMYFRTRAMRVKWSSRLARARRAPPCSPRSTR